MKSTFCTIQTFITAMVLVMLAGLCPKAVAVPYVSNLGDQWTAGGIGDIHALFPGGANYGSDTASFTTGDGQFSVNSITLEFAIRGSYPGGLYARDWLSVQLFQQVGNVNVLIGSFGNPITDPTPTQWPQSSNPNTYTEFVDFTAQGEIILNPLAQYSLVIGLPANSPWDAALLFTRSSSYISEDGWVMGPTTTGNPSASGEHLKLAVDATAVPDEANTAVLLMCGGFILCAPRLGRKLRLAISKGR